MGNAIHNRAALRILMVAPQPFFRPRGTPFSVLHRIRALLRLGHSVDLVTYPFGDTPAFDGLRVHRAARPIGVRDVAIGPSVAKLLLDVPLVHTTARLAATGHFDLLHTHEEAGIVGGPVARRAGIPHLYDMHSSLPQQFANFGRFDWTPVVAIFRGLERYTLAGADGVIAICPDLRDHVAASGYAGPLALIENTLDFDAPPPTSAELRSLRQWLGLADRKVIAYTGTLESYQGLDLLLAAAPAVLAERADAGFLIVGGTAAQIAELQRQAQDRGIADRVVFVPAVPATDVARYQRLADVLVTTRSKGTNTPLKIYQYLRAGRPIVATDIRSHRQVLDATTAELVTPDAAGIAAGLLRVLSSPARAADLARNAGRVARDRYGAAAYMDALAGLLDRIMATPHARRRSA